MFVKVGMFDIQKCDLPLLFSDFDFFRQFTRPIRQVREPSPLIITPTFGHPSSTALHFKTLLTVSAISWACKTMNTDKYGFNACTVHFKEI